MASTLPSSAFGTMWSDPHLDRRDLLMLLRCRPDEVPGLILLLNRQPRYHNGLDAIAIAVALAELRAKAQRP
ncbi:MAG TPA: hypothetical protein PLH93_07925 [Flavobacteriales bacterium]|nr:hypothetical protein [Flavobacteriales bacterium]HQW87097.1 hypothetical protein [Flavobacteriales bacterium]